MCNTWGLLDEPRVSRRLVPCSRWHEKIQEQHTSSTLQLHSWNIILARWRTQLFATYSCTVDLFRSFVSDFWKLCLIDVCSIYDWQSFKSLHYQQDKYKHHHHTTTILRPFFRDHPGEPVPEENFWALWCKGRLTKADTLTIQLGVTPSGLTSVHLHHPPYFLRARCPSCRPANSVEAL